MGRFKKWFSDVPPKGRQSMTQHSLGRDSAAGTICSMTARFRRDVARYQPDKAGEEITTIRKKNIYREIDILPALKDGDPYS